jgi:Flp pilus assembly protein TadD
LKRYHREAANKALELDDTNSEAHTALGVVKYQYDFDWHGAEAEFQRSIALSRSFAEAHHMYGWELTYEGKLEAAIAEMRRAREADPLSAVIAADQCIPFTVSHDYEAAAPEVRRALDMDPDFYLPHLNLGVIALFSGRYMEAVPELERAWMQERMPWTAAYLGFAYSKVGERDRARKLIAELDNLSKQRFVEPFNAGYIYLGLGDKEQALTLLEKAYEVRSAIWLGWLKIDPAFDPLRSEPRFIALLKKVGLDK